MLRKRNSSTDKHNYDNNGLLQTSVFIGAMSKATSRLINVDQIERSNCLSCFINSLAALDITDLSNAQSVRQTQN